MDSLDGEGLQEKEISKIADHKEKETQNIHHKVKKEEICQQLEPPNELEKDDFHIQVKNEPIDDDEEDHFQASDFVVSEIDFHVKNEECDENSINDNSNEDTNDNEDKGEVDQLTKGLQCSYCYKFLSNKRNLRLHIRTHTGDRPHQCSHCSASFVQIGHLKEHMFTHTGERPNKCSHCEKSFIHKGTLQRHIRTHSEERPFKCSYCQKYFSQKSNLQQHILTHTGERPFKCSYCPKTFLQNGNLKLHIRSHTGKTIPGKT